MADRVFVTGGASGLGRAIALRYAKDGARVLIGDLNDERGKAVEQEIAAAGGQGVYQHLDVTREQDLVAAREFVHSEWGGIDVVVNNAGIATTGFLDEEPMASWEKVIDINLLGVVRGIRTFLPLMKEQKQGHMVNVASMAGIVHPPRSASYSATKAAVVAISETLKLEAESDNIGVTVVCPSFFRTNLHESLDGEDTEQLIQKLFDRSPITAEDIADMIHRAVQRKQFYLLPHREGRMANWIKRLAPRAWYFSVMRRQTKAFMRR